MLGMLNAVKTKQKVCFRELAAFFSGVDFFCGKFFFERTGVFICVFCIFSEIFFCVLAETSL